MKELLWTYFSQLIFHLITSFQVCVSQLFSRMCQRQSASQPYLHLYLCLSLCLSHFPPPQSKNFFSSPLSFYKRKKKIVPVGLSPPSLKPALGHSDHHANALWCWMQVSVCHLLSCWQKTEAESEVVFRQL